MYLINNDKCFQNNGNNIIIWYIENYVYQYYNFYPEKRSMTKLDFIRHHILVHERRVSPNI